MGNFIVFLLIGLAVVYLVNRIIKTTKAKNGSCGCCSGCSSCSSGGCADKKSDEDEY